MTTRTDDGASPLIESRDDLLSVFSGGEKPRADWRIGTEHEKFVYRCADHRAPSWEEARPTAVVAMPSCSKTRTKSR